MGYVRDAAHKLRFEEFADDDGHCLEIRVKPLTIDEYMGVMDGDFGVDVQVELFIDHLISWNLESRNADGLVEAVPATAAGVRSQDVVFIIQLIELWTDQIVNPPAPLKRTSDGGRPSEELSLPMVALSESLAS